MIKEDYIRNLVEKYLAGSDKYVVSVKVSAGNNIRVFIDADNGVTINNCATLSKQIESELNASGDNFTLEVSSAGLDSPLLLERQYKKNIGREVNVILDDNSEHIGTLTSVSEHGIRITKTSTEKIPEKKITVTAILSLSFDQIKETKLII